MQWAQCLTDSLLFMLCINLTNNSWYTTIWNLKKKSMSRSWVRLRSSSGTQPMHFLFVVRKLDKSFVRYGWQSIWPGKTRWEFWRKKNIAENKVSNRLFPKYNQVINMARGIWWLSFVLIEWLVLSVLRRQAIFLNERHSCGLGSMNGYLVHFPRPIFSLCQICKICRKRFWYQRQIIADRVDLIIFINQNPLHVTYYL